MNFRRLCCCFGNNEMASGINISQQDYTEFYYFFIGRVQRDRNEHVDNFTLISSNLLEDRCFLVSSH